MLLRPKETDQSFYGQSLHSERELDRYNGSLLGMLKPYWEKQGGWIYTLNRKNDVQVVATTEQQIQTRAEFQGLDDFVFDVGEEILIAPSETRRLYRGLRANDVSEESIDYLKAMFADSGRVNRAGALAFHVLQVADPEAKKDPYAYWDSIKQICCGVQEHKPYYELLARNSKERGKGRYLVFMPKELVEQVAKLHPKPTGRFIHLPLKAGGRIIM